MFCPKTTQSLRITFARCIPLSLRSKKRQRSTLLLQHLFPAAVWNVVTRFPASGYLKCHYLPHLSSDLVVCWIPLHYGMFASLLFLDFYVGVGACQRTESYLSVFLLRGFTSVDREGRSTSHFHL